MPTPSPLPPCSRGDCVSTQAAHTAPLRRVEPLAHAAGLEAARAAVLTALGRVPRLRVLERDDTSVHAVIRSRWLRAPTDVELRIDTVAGLVHLRVVTTLALRERSRARARAVDLLARIDAALRER